MSCNVIQIMPRILKSVFGADAFAPFAGNFFIAVSFDFGSFKAVFAASQAPIAAPHTVTRCFVSPKEPVIFQSIDSIKGIIPGCCAVRIELTHHHRHVEKEKSG